VIPASLIIFLNNPLFISVLPWSGTTILQNAPDFVKITWLPFCLSTFHPILFKALITSMLLKEAIWSFIKH